MTGGGGSVWKVRVIVVRVNLVMGEVVWGGMG